MRLKNKNSYSVQRIAYSVAVFICCYFAVIPITLAVSPNEIKPQTPKEPIVVNGDNVEYFNEKKMVTGSGNVSIKYRDIELTCDKITVYLDTREAIAEGNVRVTQKGAYFTGERMNYNFDTRKGTVLQGYVNSKPFYGKADEVKKIENKDEYRLNEGYVTTCDLEKPHYRVRAKELTIYLGDKVVAKHIFLYVGNVPVLYLPYYVQPLKERKANITVIPGHSGEWGYYGLTSYRYYVDDKNKGDILLDYRAKMGLAEGINHYYTTKDIGVGAIKFYFSRANEFVYKQSGPVEDRYRWQVRHDWDLGEDTDTKLTLEFNKMSDKDVIKDYFYNEYQEIGANPDNYITLITQKPSFSTEFLIRKRFDNFQDVVERLPEFDITIPDNNIFPNTTIYYRANASAVYLNHTFDNTNTATPLKDLNTGRIDAYNQVSYTTKLFKAISVTPYVANEETYYSRLTGSTDRIRTVFSAGVNSQVKFYKIYDVDTNLLGLDIHKLRHVITPTVNYFYTHDPTIEPTKLNQFDGIDAIDKTNGVFLGLENRLQTKRMDSSVDLATLLVSTNYLFDLKKGSFEAKEDHFTPIQFDLEILPYSAAYMKATMAIDPKTYTVQSESIDLVSSGGDKWSFDMSNRYESTADAVNSLITLDGTYKINDKWKIRAYERFNTYKAAFEEQEYTLTRDLHCWIMELTFDFANTGDIGVWAVLKLKAFPQTPIGLKQTYSRPRFGEAGSQ